MMLSEPDPRKSAWLLNRGRRALNGLTDILTGHCRLKRHLSLLGIEADSTCRRCGAEEETSFHFLVECEALGRHRYNFFVVASITLYQLQELYGANILNFIRVSGWPDGQDEIYIVNSDDMIGVDVQPQLNWDYKVDSMSFSVKQTYTTEDTRQLSIKQRRCIFEDEIKLKVDQKYTYTACTIQCRMEIFRGRCNCVPFFYPKVPGFAYCNISSQKCISKYLTDIMDISKCDCQLGCKNTVYEVEAQIANPTTSTLKKMEIGFVSWPMVRYKREVLFGWVDLLVSFGGIAGLFLGFSLLSGVEIIYYFTIRTCIAAFRERKYLDRIRKENKEKAQPIHDLSLVPYLISEPLPGHGIDIVVKSFDAQKGNFQKAQKHKKNNKIKVGMMPPFGIEFLH